MDIKTSNWFLFANPLQLQYKKDMWVDLPSETKRKVNDVHVNAMCIYIIEGGDYLQEEQKSLQKVSPYYSRQ